MVETEELSEQCEKCFVGNGKMSWESKGRRSRSVGFGFGLGEGFRACQLPCGQGVGDLLQLHKEDLAGALRVFRTPDEGAVRRMCIQMELFVIENCRMR